MWCETGGPSVPLLFVLAPALLKTTINKLLHLGENSLPLPIHDPDYPVIQYADDTLLFLHAHRS